MVPLENLCNATLGSTKLPLHRFGIIYKFRIFAAKLEPESLTFGQSSNWLDIITLISMVAVEKLYNTAPGLREQNFYSI